MLSWFFEIWETLPSLAYDVQGEKKCSSKPFHPASLAISKPLYFDRREVLMVMQRGCCQ